MPAEGPSAPRGDDDERAAKEGPSAPRGDDHGRAANETFPRRLRLRQRREFLRVQRSGAKHHTRFFLVFVAPTPFEAAPVEAGGLPGTRLGVTVTRKVGKAVKRNRIKRLVREVFRRERGALPAGLDMVWVAKRDAVGTTFEDVVHDMRTLAGRLRSR